jgi:hypothetical protein
VNLSVRDGYDDNINNVSTGKQDGFTTSIEPQLLLNFPQERTFFGLRYTYGATIYWSQRNRTDQSHTADLLFSHEFSTRLVLDASDQIRRGIEPGLVELFSGVPVITRRRGDYLFNNAEASLRYSLTRRWSTSINGSWGLWRYDDAGIATTNDRDEYNTTVSALYALSSRTTVGINYQHRQVDYKDAGQGNRNSVSHVGFLSMVRRFNPKLSLRMSGGMEFREFSDGTSQTAPSANAALTYNYGRDSSLSLGMSYSLSTTEVGSFRSTDSLVGFLNASHRLTARLSASASASFVVSTYQNPTPGFFVTSGLEEDALQLSVGLAYAFRRWLSGDMGYTYDKVNSDVGGRSFDRNRVYAGIRLSY